MRSEFNLIVIDGSTLGQKDDLAAMAAQAEFTILVVADDGAMLQSVRTAKAALSGLSKTRLGIVINKARASLANPVERLGQDRPPAKSASLA